MALHWRRKLLARHMTWAGTESRERRRFRVKSPPAPGYFRTVAVETACTPPPAQIMRPRCTCRLGTDRISPSIYSDETWNPKQ